MCLSEKKSRTIFLSPDSIPNFLSLMQVKFNKLAGIEIDSLAK